MADSSSARSDADGFQRADDASISRQLLPEPRHSDPFSGQTATTLDGFIEIIFRRWRVGVLTLIGVVAVAIVYVFVATPTFTSTSNLLVIPMDPASISSSANASQMQPDDDDFIQTQCVVINTGAVLALAMDKIQDTRTLKGVAHPMEYVADRIQVDPSKAGRTIVVSFDSHYPEEASLIVDSVVDAYIDYETDAWKNRSNQFVAALTQGSATQDQERVRLLQRIHDMALLHGFTLDGDPEKSPQHAEVLSLRDAADKAKLEALRAHDAYEEASKSIAGHPERMQAVADAERDTVYSNDPEDQMKLFRAELAREQVRLGDDSRNYLPNHPVIIADRARVNAMIVSTVIAAKQWEYTAKSQEEAIEVSLKSAEEVEQKISDSQREYIQLRADADRLKKASDSVDERVRQFSLSQSAGALNISVLNTARVALDHPKPDVLRSLLMAIVFGTVAGVGLACLADWNDDRMRTLHMVRSAVGAPVLGAIPIIATSEIATARGQIVHCEPFGDSAESFRTLRTSLQFALSATAKTVLITSPVSGDGKSILVSNLAIAMAQLSKRILIIDADFRAPMQHRLFDLPGKVGFASVLSGIDTLEQAIQHTEIRGLDILACGPTPPNPAELLNSPEFGTRLGELADKYDCVLLDSPPILAVADARILGAFADASLMVIGLDSCTHGQAELARDGMRSVGANLIGVAVNRVRDVRHFGSASGYYGKTRPPRDAKLSPLPHFTEAATKNPRAMRPSG